MGNSTFSGTWLLLGPVSSFCAVTTLKGTLSKNKSILFGHVTKEEPTTHLFLMLLFGKWLLIHQHENCYGSPGWRRLPVMKRVQESTTWRSHHWSVEGRPSQDGRKRLGILSKAEPTWLLPVPALCWCVLLSATSAQDRTRPCLPGGPQARSRFWVLFSTDPTWTVLNLVSFQIFFHSLNLFWFVFWVSFSCFSCVIVVSGTLSMFPHFFSFTPAANSKHFASP